MSAWSPWDKRLEIPTQILRKYLHQAQLNSFILRLIVEFGFFCWIYVHQIFPRHNENRSTSSRWISPNRFKIYKLIYLDFETNSNGNQSWVSLMFSRKGRRNWRVTYISGGKLRPSCVHRFSNHARLSAKVTLHIYSSRVNLNISRLVNQPLVYWWNFFDSCIQIPSTIVVIWTQMIHLWLVWKKSEKGMLRSDICKNEGGRQPQIS